jgi:EAL domain-containing protein (putative c-di-GMP-specific phosphodiesterase class I)
MENLDRSVDVLSVLKALGVRIDVDDFGTGYSSLAYVHRLPIDTLKIDKGFVNPLDAQHADSSIIAAVVALGRSLDIAVLAEGVETQHQLGLLSELGCDLAQGFLFARPLSGADFVELIEQGPLPHLPGSLAAMLGTVAAGARPSLRSR